MPIPIVDLTMDAAPEATKFWRGGKSVLVLGPLILNVDNLNAERFLIKSSL